MQNEFTQVDFGPLQEYLNSDDVTDISYSNGGQVWLKTLSRGVFRVENPAINNAFMEKMAFQCANSMGKSFNMANPFLDAESDELRMNFVHDSIARNGIAVLIRKTPAKIRLEKDKIIKEDYIRLDIHDFILKCVEGHCNILVSGETGSGKTEFVKYMAAHTKVDEKLITIEDTLELHLDKIFPQRDIVAMKTNNIASYADVLVTCMRQNPRWILLSEVRSAEAVMAVRDSISSGHNILSTIHADKAESIPSRLYSLLESSIDMDQFLRSIHRYVQIGVHIKGYYSKELQRFKREVCEVVEFFVDDNNKASYNILYKKTPDGKVTLRNPTKYLLGYLESQGVIIQPDILVKEEFKSASDNEANSDIKSASVNSGVVANTSVNPSSVVNSVNNNNMVSRPVNTGVVANTNVNPSNVVNPVNSNNMVSRPINTGVVSNTSVSPSNVVNPVNNNNMVSRPVNTGVVANTNTNPSNVVNPVNNNNMASRPVNTGVVSNTSVNPSSVVNPVNNNNMVSRPVNTGVVSNTNINPSSVVNPVNNNNMVSRPVNTGVVANTNVNPSNVVNPVNKIVSNGIVYPSN